MAKTAAPPLDCKLTLETTLTLFDVLLQQYQHAINADKEGHPALLEQFNKLMPFFNFVMEYTNKYSK